MLFVGGIGLFVVFWFGYGGVGFVFVCCVGVDCGCLYCWFVYGCVGGLGVVLLVFVGLVLCGCCCVGFVVCVGWWVLVFGVVVVIGGVCV